MRRLSPRAAIESTAENFSDGVVAPLLWGVLLGLPGMLAYKAINTADSMIGHRSPRYVDFGWFAARLDDVANWLPARACGAADPRGRLLLPRRDARAPAGARCGATRRATARSTPAGRRRRWPAASGLRLAGPRRYGGQMVEDAWMGDGSVAGDARRHPSRADHPGARLRADRRPARACPDDRKPVAAPAPRKNTAEKPPRATLLRMFIAG